jgi:hypothetical protein
MPTYQYTQTQAQQLREIFAFGQTTATDNELFNGTLNNIQSMANAGDPSQFNRSLVLVAQFYQLDAQRLANVSLGSVLKTSTGTVVSALIQDKMITRLQKNISSRLSFLFSIKPIEDVTAPVRVGEDGLLINVPYPVDENY